MSPIFAILFLSLLPACISVSDPYHHGGSVTSPTTCFTRWRDCVIVNAQPFFRRAMITEEQCMTECRTQQQGKFICRSIVYDRVNRICDLFSHKGNYFPGKLVKFSGRDYYEYNPSCSGGQRGVTPTTGSSGDVCPAGHSSLFLVQEGMALEGHDDVVIPNQSREQCKTACKTQRTPLGQSAACASFDHNAGTRECKITDKAFSANSNFRLMRSPGTAYFELFCVPANVASGVTDEIFQSMNTELVGSADDVETAPNFRDCIRKCLEFTEFPCRSAMFFYKENTKNCFFSRSNKDSPGFQQLLIEVNDPERPVDYFQPNFFVTGRRRLSPSQDDVGNEDNLAAAEINETRLTGADIKHLRFTLPRALEDEPVSHLGEWTEWTKCDRPVGGRRVRYKICIKSNIKDCQTESQWCDDDNETQLQSDVIDTPVSLHTDIPCPIGECCSHKGSCLIGLVRLPNNKARWCTRPCGRKL